MSNIIRIGFKQKFKELFCKKKRKRYQIVGANNIIQLSNTNFARCFRIHIYGNNNIIDIRTNKMFKADIFIGTPDCFAENCRVIVGEEATSNGVMIRLSESESMVDIGEDAMFSDKIEIYCSDTHSIFDVEGNLTNCGHYVNIGKHVWIGTGVGICKNTKIAEGCVIGMKSVVSGNFEKNNCVIVGNPARMVKENITWSRERPNAVLQ